MDLGYNCSVTVATDSQSVIDHSRRRGHSVASKHVSLRGLSLQEALMDKKLELEKVDTAMNPADMTVSSMLVLSSLTRSRSQVTTSEISPRGVLMVLVGGCRCVSGPGARVVVVRLFRLDLVSFSLPPFAFHGQPDRRSRCPSRSW